jgi:chaperonin GroES
MQIKPILNRVLIQPIEDSTQTKSGLFLAASSSDPVSVKGTVVAVGPGARDAEGKHIPMSVKKDDVVFYTKSLAKPVKIDDTEYVVLLEDQILAIVE